MRAGDGQVASARVFRTPVRGTAYAAVPPAEGAPLVPGTPVALLREPENPADPFAVAVWLVEGSGPRWRLGYLDRTVAARIAPRLDAGAVITATLDGWVDEPGGRWRRPLLRLDVRGSATERSGPDGRVRRLALHRQPPGVQRRRLRA
jgi:hypothetical protein